MTVPAYFMLRLRRDGPLTPAKLWLCDHDPADPENRLDRGALSRYPRAEIGGREAPPEILLDRLGVRWPGDLVPRPAVIIPLLANPADLVPRPVEHWAYAAPIDEAEYRYRLAHLDWTRQSRPADPVGRPRERVAPAQLPLPNFDRERALVG